jgi:GcrA cell cycle regulator
MSWTDERIQELTDLWQQGLSASEIGKRLGVSKNAVVGKAHRLNLPSRPSPIKQQGAEGAEPTSAETVEANRRSSRGNGGGNGKPNGHRKETTGASNGSRKRNGAATGNGAGTVGNPASIRAQVEARGGRSGCLWPIGDPNDPGFHFCEAATAPGKPYCSEHAARAYITRSRGDREERDEEAA